MPVRKGLLAICSLLIMTLLATAVSAQEAGSLYDLTLEELSRLRVFTGGSLTKTDARKVPASITTITRDMIESSGARGLDELLEIYVPNYFRLKHVTPGPVFGLRGIISGRPNKTLLLVNGRIMNQRALLGAISERFLPLLGDIESIEVVRGPGSAVYGPGAINGVINIRTRTTATFSGFDISIGQGLIEGFTLGELRFGHALSDDASIFAYYGLAHYGGAAPEDAPVVFSRTTDYFTAEVPVDSGIVNDNRAMDGKPHHKAHLEVRYRGTRLWGRLVRGSIHFLPARSEIESRGGFQGITRGLRYQQETLQGEHDLKLGRAVAVQLRASYDVQDMVRRFSAIPVDREYSLALRERELGLRSVVSWSPSNEHVLAVGVEFFREWFGETPTRFTDDPAHNGNTTYQPWATNSSGLFGEYQWNPSERWTVFLGGRADDHSFTSPMYSPRAAVVFSLDDRSAVKLLLNRSVRKADDVELKTQADDNPGFKGEVEEITALEARYEFRGDGLSASAVAFRNNVDLMAWIGPPVSQLRPTGESDVAGLEVEFGFQGRRWDVGLSYSFTKLLDFNLINVDLRNQNETSAPYGYGNDLQNWPRHIGKFTWRARLTQTLTTVGSGQLYWGFQGAQDYAEYNTEVLQQATFSLIDEGRNDAFRGNAFLNVGLLQQFPQGLRIEVNAHNILGWIEPNLNKRNTIARMAQYQLEAPALSFRMGYSF